jgi:hypothetical protein
MTADPARLSTSSPEPKWEPLTPEQVAELMRGVEIPWWIAGGWALDLFAGRQTRAHTDIEISVFRADVDVLRRHLRGWEIAVAEAGSLASLDRAQPLPKEAHELWCREPGREGWQLEVLVEERDGDRWSYRRDPRIGAHAKDIGRLTDDGVPYIRPDIQLLYKSKGSRAVDESDLIALLPRLDAAQRATLSAWISAGDPTHRWLARLRF